MSIFAAILGMSLWQAVKRLSAYLRDRCACDCRAALSFVDAAVEVRRAAGRRLTESYGEKLKENAADIAALKAAKAAVRDGFSRACDVGVELDRERATTRTWRI